MNKWFYRAVGAVGVAGGALLLSSGVAHAEHADEARSTVDPQVMRGLVADLFTPTGGPHYVGLSIDEPAAQSRPTAGGREEFLGGLFGGLTDGGPLGGLTSSLTGSGPLGGLAGSLTGGGPLSGLTGSLTGGDGAGLLGGLTGGGKSGLLGGLTGGLMGDNGPLSAVTGGLTGGLDKGPLSSLSGLTSGLTGDSLTGQTPALDPALLKDLLTDDQLAALTTQGPASTDIIDPALRGSDADTTGSRPIQLDPDLARQVNDATGPMLSAMIADAVAQQMGMAAGDLGLPTGSGDAVAAGALPTGSTDPAGALPSGSTDAERAGAVTEGLPFVSDLPIVGSLLGSEGPLGKVVVVGDFANKLPLVGDLLGGNLDPSNVGKLPVVGNLLNNGLLKSGDGPKLPIVGNLPFLGDALSNLGQTAAAAQPSNPLSGLTPDQMRALPGLNPTDTRQPGARPAQPGPSVPGPAMQGPAMQGPAAQPDGQATTPAHVGRHRATDRPEVIDPDLESGTLPLVGALTGDNGGVGTFPLSTLMRDVPLINEVPLVGDLGSPLEVLNSLPLVSSLTGLLPIESDTAA